MSLREDVWADKNSLTPPHFIEVSVPSPESERTYICVRGSIFPLSMIFHLDCGSVSTVWYFSLGLWKCFHSVVFFTGYHLPVVREIICIERYTNFRIKSRMCKSNVY